MIKSIFVSLSKFSNSAYIFLIFSVLATGFSCTTKIENPPPKPLAKAATFYGAAEKIGEPFGIAVRNDEIYVADGETGRILKISKAGVMSVLTDRLDTPSQIAFDKNGDLLVADAGTHTIKKIKPTGEIELVAGVENQAGYTDGEARSALFNAPVGIAVKNEDIYVADTYNDRIRVIERHGVVATVAGSSRGFADGVKSQAKFDTPTALALTADGRLVIADSNNRRIRIIESDQTVRTLAGGELPENFDGKLNENTMLQPTALTIARNGAVYFADGNAIRAIDNLNQPLIRTVSSDRRGYADGNLSEARFNRPSGLAFDDNGSLFIADAENQVVRVMTGEEIGKIRPAEEIENSRIKPGEFRQLAPPRWSYSTLR